ncbi:hypothetical protein [Streptomyces exfoliatus]|uniref:hypothetical protein n=1 Tax=Streptomyces exfoliatus TaxID=1905 RepID=UPI003C2B625D
MSGSAAELSTEFSSEAETAGRLLRVLGVGSGDHLVASGARTPRADGCLEHAVHRDPAGGLACDTARI